MPAYPRQLPMTDRPYRYLFVIAGESNAGGAAPVSGLPAPDLTACPFAKIWNPTSNTFELLQIGTNNLIGHTGFANNVNVGIERGLIRDEGVISLNEIYVLKAAHGGSTIAQWATGASTGYLATLFSRYTAAKSALEQAGYNVKPVFIWWLGINDAAIPTVTATWKAAVQALFSNVRSVMGPGLPIYMYKLMTNAPNGTTRAAYNTEIDAMTASDLLLYAVNIPAGAEQQVDGSHYTAQGYVTAWNALIDRFLATQGFSTTATKGSPRGFVSNRPSFAMVHMAGTSIAAVTYSTATTLPMVAVSDPDGCFASNGFKVPSWGAGTYQINWQAGVSTGCTQLSVSVQFNGVDVLRSPITTLSADGIYTNGGSDLGFLSAGDLVTLSVIQSNTTSAARTFLTTGLQRPRLTLYRLQT
jgi:Carbohydrate esterase, sialic acid-specific acetylesterase